MNIVLNGCNGKLGRAIVKVASEKEDMQIIAGVTRNEKFSTPFPIFASFNELPLLCDVIIDASNPAAIQDILDFAIAKNIPLVIATTGYSDAQLELIENAAKSIPIFISYNMSIGINLLCELAKTTAKVLGSTFDIEILEAHHNQKLDAPSGTAIMLAQALGEGLDYEPEYTYDRHEKREKRGRNEIGIHSVRGGTITGEHEIIFAGYDEVIKISHSALSKDIFAAGVLNAASFISTKPAGKYSMKDLVAQN